jgi:hypothetical protein
MKISEVPMWVVGGVVVLGGLGFLAWHSYARDDDDEAWLDPGQPPAQVALPLVPLSHGNGSPMSCNGAFRSRCYPDVMATASAVLKGEV